MSVSVFLGMLLAASCPQQASVLERSADAVGRIYVDAAESARISSALRSWSREGRYASACADPQSFLAQLNRDLDAYDGHFHVEQLQPDKPEEDWLMAWRADAGPSNAGVREVRVLEGNVGYLRLSTFYPWDLASNKLASAFSLLADTSALVLDLRQNGGGDDETADQIVRAFVGNEVQEIQSIETRKGTKASPLPPSRLGHYAKPLVVLVDRRTGSAAEYVAYSMQALGRAHVVGSRTGGAASMLGEPVVLTEGFQIAIPDARPLNLTTKSNWEKVGVRPDKSGGDDSLHVARQTLERLAPLPGK